MTKFFNYNGGNGRQLVMLGGGHRFAGSDGGRPAGRSNRYEFIIIIIVKK